MGILNIFISNLYLTMSTSKRITKKSKAKQEQEMLYVFFENIKQELLKDISLKPKSLFVQHEIQVIKVVLCSENGEKRRHFLEISEKGIKSVKVTDILIQTFDYLASSKFQQEREQIKKKETNSALEENSDGKEVEVGLIKQEEFHKDTFYGNEK